VLELGLEVCQRIEVVDTRDLESDLRYVLGAVANGTNDAASSILHTKRFFDIRLAVAEEAGCADERLARAYNQMGVAWMMAEEYEKAEEAFATSAREYEKLPDYTKDKRSLALVNLGLSHWLQNNIDAASETLELGLADREELYGVMDSHSFRYVRP
jgi:tetratricopeptide (TPR) repeat protein